MNYNYSFAGLSQVLTHFLTITKFIISISIQCLLTNFKKKNLRTYLRFFNKNIDQGSILIKILMITAT